MNFKDRKRKNMVASSAAILDTEAQNAELARQREQESEMEQSHVNDISVRQRAKETPKKTSQTAERVTGTKKQSGRGAEKVPTVFSSERLQEAKTKVIQTRAPLSLYAKLNMIRVMDEKHTSIGQMMLDALNAYVEQRYQQLGFDK